jgi:hypothetical protein
MLGGRKNCLGESVVRQGCKDERHEKSLHISHRRGEAGRLTAGAQSATDELPQESAYHCTLRVPTMLGWIAQWYVNVPGDWNVVLKLPPGAMFPEFQLPLSDREVCVVLSLFTQVTVVPAAMLTGLGV